MASIDLTAEQVRRALLDQNYMPRASRRGDDLPPSLSTLGMNAVSASIVERFTSRHRFRKETAARTVPGFSLPEARVAHFRLSPRRVEIPHPVAYSNLVETIAKHWTDVLAPLVNSPASQFTIRQHEDGRIASMEQRRRPLRPGVGSRFRVTTDIASFYDSIYTHAVPWAILGKSVAKSARNTDIPANDIDAALMFARRGETTGISIGPGTSLIVAEVLLCRVDEALGDFRFERFLDDYVAFTRTESEAEEFVRVLDSQLRSYGLKLNGRKTVIEALPLPDLPAWIRELRRAPDTRPGDLLDRAIDLAHADPQASSIRWALTRLRRQVAGSTRPQIRLLTQRLAELSFTHPYTTSALVEIVLDNGVDLPEHDLNQLIQKHTADAQTSAVCWLLHLAWTREYTIDEKSWEAIVAGGDPLPLAYLLSQPAPSRASQRDALLSAVASGSEDDYTRDEAWPVRYAAFREGREEAQEPGFEEMFAGGVQLLRDPRRPVLDEPLGSGETETSQETPGSEDTAAVRHSEQIVGSGGDRHTEGTAVPDATEVPRSREVTAPDEGDGAPWREDPRVAPELDGVDDKSTEGDSTPEGSEGDFGAVKRAEEPGPGERAHDSDREWPRAASSPEEDAYGPEDLYGPEEDQYDPDEGDYLVDDGDSGPDDEYDDQDDWDWWLARGLSG
ncbi:reverse transcriptase domain-containing protein [Agromyces sp. S2-1-8]|uniref:reverse transcriptase domain-containing protein n=1 Tax=Agromyces sp. S2-1-8 TaxID=2897180 RepID=UPI001E4AE494|nr:reverse transcriptase domain-containing protein [Agromyces sp. S2-1-8]MCD5346131.1 hypothetical protein [Agromyces sp. S2-1-8]